MHIRCRANKILRYCFEQEIFLIRHSLKIFTMRTSIPTSIMLILLAQVFTLNLKKYIVSKNMLFVLFLTLPVPISDKEKKIKLNFYFLTSLWCLKRFYEGLKGLHKNFWGTTKKCENKLWKKSENKLWKKNLIFTSI